jgi:acetyl esterase/lipase
MAKIADRSIDLAFYPAPGERPRGAVIVCPGGGYQGLADHEGEPIARWLNNAGISAFVLRYRVAPHRHPAPLDDITRAVRLARAKAAEFQIKPDKIGVLGFSAGGHLVTTIATHYDAGDAAAADPIDRASSRPDAVVACYAVVSFENMAHTGSLRNLLGDNPGEKLIHHLSNELHVTENTPPTFLWHTADDEAVPVEHSLMFARALAQKKVPFELHVFPKGKHGLGLGDGSSFVGKSEQVAQWPRLCALWLASLGF